MATEEQIILNVDYKEFVGAYLVRERVTVETTPCNSAICRRSTVLSGGSSV